MDNKEKVMRCCDTEIRVDEDDNVIMCKVYTRWVSECNDCSFYVK